MPLIPRASGKYSPARQKVVLFNRGGYAPKAETVFTGISQRQRFPSNSEGFTLVEVLLSAFLISIVVGVLFASFFIPARAVGARKAELVRLEEPVIFLYRFTEEVAAAYYREPDFPFHGTAGSLEFFSGAGTDFGLNRVSYLLEEEDGGKVVVYRTPDDNGEKFPVFQAEAAALSYYDGEEWQDAWEADGLPVMVSLKIHRAERTFEVWLAPRADSDHRPAGDSHPGDNSG
jgi:hypothetical protein